MVWECCGWESLHCINGGLGLWIPHKKINMGIHTGIRKARREVVSTLFKWKYSLKEGEWVGSVRWNQPLDCFGMVLLVLSELRSVVTYSGVVSNGGCFQSFGKFFLHVERSFNPKGFVWDWSWHHFPQGSGSYKAMQMHYNESLGYPKAEVEDESTYSVPVALDLLGPSSRCWVPLSFNV